MLKCIICSNPLKGLQKKYCSKKCKNTSLNNKHQNYIAQQTRGKNRRQQLVDSLGGKCSICGYSKNTAALCFHHSNASEKLFNIDLRKCSNSTLDSLIKESLKCELVCSNCHAEIHNPDFNT